MRAGVPRLTRDIDIAIAGADLSVGNIVNELSRAGIEPRIKDALAFAEENQVLLARHRDSGVRDSVNVSRAWLPSESKRSPRPTWSRSEGSVSMAETREISLQFKAIAWRPRTSRT